VIPCVVSSGLLSNDNPFDHITVRVNKEVSLSDDIYINPECEHIQFAGGDLSGERDSSSQGSSE
jgi:hypothetical protein